MKKTIKKLSVWLLVMLMTFGCFFTNVYGASVVITTTTVNNPATIDGYELSLLLRDINTSGTYTEGEVTVVVTFDGSRQFVNWTSNVPIPVVYVKGGSSANVYHYSPAQTSGTDLRAPNNVGGQQPDISHVNFYYAAQEEQGTPNLTIEKTASPTTVQPGDTVTYSITVTNEGDGAATGVKVIETLPEQMVLPEGGLVDWTEDSGSYIHVIGTLAAGASSTITFNAVVKSDLVEVDTIPNTAKVNCIEDTEYKQDTVEITVEYPQEETAPSLTIEKTASPTTVQPGGTVAYSITVTNEGDGAATGVKVIETLPEQTVLPEGGPGGWTLVSEGSRDYYYEIGSLAAGATSPAITFNAVVKNDLVEVNTIPNTAKVNCTEDTEYKQDMVEITVEYPENPEKQKPSISKTDGGVSAHPGDVVTYHFTIDPNDYSLVGGYLIETPDRNTVFVSGDGWVEDRTDESGRTIYKYNLGSEVPRLAAVAAPVIPDFKVRVKSTTPRSVTLAVNNVALYYAEGEDPVVERDTTPIIHPPIDIPDDDRDDHHDSNPGIPDLFVTKTDNGSVVSPGGLVEYVITVENKGTAYAQGVKIYESLPEGATFVADRNPGWALVDGKFVYDIGTFNVGDKKEAKFILKVNDPFPAELEKLLNNVEVKDNGTETATADNKASDDTPVLHAKAATAEPPVTPPPPPPPPETTGDGETQVPDLPFTGGMAEVELLFAGMGALLVGAGLVLKRK